MFTVRLVVECIPDLGLEQSGGESTPTVVGSVYRLLERRRARSRLGLIAGSADWMVYEGRHRGDERVERSEERVQKPCLSGTGSGRGGTWLCETFR